MMEDLEKRSKTAGPEELAAMSSPPSADARQSMTLDDVRHVTSSPMEHTLGPYFAAELPHLLNMRCTVLCTPSDPGFITSDAPVVWFSPEWHKKPPMFQSPSLSDPLLEISMPVSPSQMLILSTKPLLLGDTKLSTSTCLTMPLKNSTGGHGSVAIKSSRSNAKRRARVGLKWERYLPTHGR